VPKQFWKMKKFNQPWLDSPLEEIIFILLPALLPVAVVFIFRGYFVSHPVSTAWWVVLVLCVDVSHVYSTLFRLYWDKPTFVKYKKILVAIPAAAFAVGLALHFYDSLLFWRILAYIAVYHFVRQQYGFMRLYSRLENSSHFERLIDSAAIYAATIYPLLYWHAHATDKLAWFVKGDFIPLPLASFEIVMNILYMTIILSYTIKELIITVRSRFFNIPKNLLVIGTFLSWYVGIVAFQGDLIFTLLNVVAHGIPYMALIWIHGKKRAKTKFTFSWKGVIIFLGILFILAYAEEYLWDGMIWSEHTDIFPFIDGLDPLQNPLLISVTVSLLVLPQITHYVLDGFIWRFSKDNEARIGQ
jgi:hypothetical protein